MSPGFGFVASAKVVSGGGGSVTIEEVTKADVAGSVSGSLTLTSTLVSTDLVVLLMTKQSSGTNTVTINGSAPTSFGSWQIGVGAGWLYVYTKTGLTGSHAFAYTTASSTAVNHYTAFVVRGLSSASITNSAISVWSSTGTASNTDEGPASMSAVAGQVAIFAAVSGGGTTTFPSNPTPSSGWVTDRLENGGPGLGSVAHLVVTGSTSVQANVRSNLTTPLGTTMLLLG